MTRLSENRAWLPAVAVTVGAAVMAIEITASRALAPHFGASLFVWTSLIVTVLLAMSVGYWFGGRLASLRHDLKHRLGLLMLGSACMLLFGTMSVGRLGSTFPSILGEIGGATAVLFVGSLLTSFLVFATPVFLLAVASPVIVSVWATGGEDPGRAAGRYFALSTVGSVAGTILPTLVTVPVFGVRATFVMVSLVLAALGLPAVRGRARSAMVLAVGLLLLAVLTRGSALPKDVVARYESPYQLISVMDGTDGSRYLTFNEASGVQSVLRPPGVRTNMYYDHIAMAPFLAERDPGDQRVAVLGLAGGTLVRQMTNVIPEGSFPEVFGVEVDSRVIDVGREWFGTGDLPMEVVNRDGRGFLATTDMSFDTVIVDAYSTQMYIPSHMATLEFFSEVRERLVPGGVMALNINAPDRDSPLLAAMINSVAAVFPEVRVSKAGRTWNWLVVASDREPDYIRAVGALPDGYADVAEALLTAKPAAFDSGAQVLTDDRAPVEHMTDRMILNELF